MLKMNFTTQWSTFEQRRKQASLTMLCTPNTYTGQCRSQSSYNYTEQKIPYSSLKNKTPHELILSAVYTTLERTTD